MSASVSRNGVVLSSKMEHNEDRVRSGVRPVGARVMGSVLLQITAQSTSCATPNSVLPLRTMLSVLTVQAGLVI